ncbi:unnamed protein product [Lasius platythorax]|uniref:Transposase domain-containing protein n=1 Tax=Lasius platythorax TaxID=488582 RepID=A0AAV2N116_9HYME
MQNKQTAGTLADLIQSSQSDELNTTAIDVSSSNENENIGSLNEIVQDDNYCKESDTDVNCNDEIDNDGFVSEDDFDLFESPDINYDINDDAIMFEAAGLSISQVFIMIQALCLRYHHSDESRHALLNLVKILAGPKFSHINITKYTMSKRYNPPANKILYVFYCTQCYSLLLNPLSKDHIGHNKSATCGQCEERYQISTNSSNYFLSINVKYQIRALLEDKNIREIVMNNLANVNTRSQETNNISDVYDSHLYKDIAQNKKCIVLTFNFNTDGFPVFKSSKNSIWPVLLIINEIPPKYRFQTLILAALWMSKCEPKANFMNLYLQIFIKQIEKLMNNGITILNSNNENITFVLRPLCASVDSVARPIMQNRYQFNGYFGCSWCYANGVHVHGSMRYPFTENDSQRNHVKYLKDIQEVKRMQRPVYGVKGPSILTELKYFDCVWGFPVDYMHGIMLGVVRQMWAEWNSPSSPFYLSRKQRDNVDKRLLNIKPPKEIHRLPRSFKEGKLKASEWRSWTIL